MEQLAFDWEERRDTVAKFGWRYMGASIREELYFRRFTEADLPELEAMVLALYAEDVYGEPMSSDKIQRTVQELERHPQKGQIILFWLAEAVVGYAIIIYFWSNEYGGNIATLDEFYVKPEWRGKGIGTAFLSHLAATEDTSVKGIQLEVTPSNERALAYYLRQGFSPAANRHLFKTL